MRDGASSQRPRPAPGDRNTGNVSFVAPCNISVWDPKAGRFPEDGVTKTKWISSITKKIGDISEFPLIRTHGFRTRVR